MPGKEAQIETLQKYLPEGTFSSVLNYLKQYKVHLTISRKRKSILGDYRHRTQFSNHRISVNGNLNPFSFLITLLHELAHLLTYEQHSNKVLPHGREWKIIYSKMLENFLSDKVFPPDIESELRQSIINPAASSCVDECLLRVLRKYDQRKSSWLLLEEIPEAAFFKIENGRVFIKGEKLRKRIKCREVHTKKEFLFSPVYEVEVVCSE